MRSKLICLLIGLMTSTWMTAQKLPNCNIYLFDMKQASDTSFQFTNPRYLTHFNKDGYNNQPHFVNDEELYLTVQMASDTTQTDIYSLNIKHGIKTRVTATQESEYSPTLKFEFDRELPPAFTCVRVETDGKETQRLWTFPMDRSNNGQPIFEKVVDIGYHTWSKPNEAVLFVVGAPHRLVVANIQTQTTTNITSNIGRCFQRMAPGYVAFVHKISAESWLIKVLNTGSRRSELITATLLGAEDYVILRDGTFLMAKGSKLYKFNKKLDVDWREIADFRQYGIDNISRLAIREGKYLALVDN